MKRKNKHKSKGKGLLFFALVLVAIGIFSSGGDKTKQSTVKENIVRSSVIIQSTTNEPTAQLAKRNTPKPTVTPSPTKTPVPTLTDSPTSITTTIPTTFTATAQSHATKNTQVQSTTVVPIITEYLLPRTPTSPPSSTRQGTNNNAVFPQTTAQTTPVPGTNYVLNRKSGVFHYPSCRDVKKMQDKNRIDFFGTRDEVISKGYSPCGHCHP